jgi:hypothetical protein
LGFEWHAWQFNEPSLFVGEAPALLTPASSAAIANSTMVARAATVNSKDRLLPRSGGGSAIATPGIMTSPLPTSTFPKDTVFYPP